ncbi:MAG: transpeptidase family protein [Opitutaceae bacterium]|nr:transpeptidase family protein [Cytophagales bacterium]
MGIKFTILLRVRLAFMFVLAFSLAIIWKVAHLQIVEGAHWKEVAEEILLDYKDVKATRGNIYSDNGSLLATSLPFYQLAFDPTAPKDKYFREGIDSLSMLMSRFFGDRSPEEYKRKLTDARKKRKRYLILSEKNLTYGQKKIISSWPIFRLGQFRGGVVFDKIDKRHRPFGYMAFRTVGFVNDQNQGAGLEYSYNSQLGGKKGEALFQRIAGGNWRPLYDENYVKPEDGYDIQTTLDVNLQDVAEDALYRHLLRHDADYGTVVLMEVKTGEIKAMANLSKNSAGGYEERYNYAVGDQGLTEPGSTIKLASLLALFEDSDLNLKDTVFGDWGRHAFYDRIMVDSKPEGYGTLTVKEAFAYSSNIGVAKLVVDHFGSKPQKYIDYLQKFGLGKKVGFQMAGEAQPYIKNTYDSSWSGISLPWICHGYEMKLAPIHTLCLYNAVANDGKMIKPIIVKEVRKADKILEKYETDEIVEKICSEKTLAKAREMLEEVVVSGTAKNIAGTHYKIAGKTGTAQRLVKGRYTKTYYTSFAGYFPADKPKYSCIVVIDNPKGYNQYGADVAAPVFKEIADKVYATDKEMHKLLEEKKFFDKEGIFPMVKAGFLEDLRYLCNHFGISNHANEKEDWVAAVPKNNAIIWQNRVVRKELVPDCKGFTLKDAMYVLGNNGLRVEYSGTGRVVQQSLVPGQRIVKGWTIHLKLG